MGQSLEFVRGQTQVPTRSRLTCRASSRVTVSAMSLFDEIKPGARIKGRRNRFGPDEINLVFRVGGRIAERLLYRGEEAGFEILAPATLTASTLMRDS